jgi:hypothetical protein
MKQITAYLLNKKNQLDIVPNPQEVSLLLSSFFGTTQKITVSIQKQTVTITAPAVIKNELLIRKDEVLRLINTRYQKLKNIRFV